MKINGGGLIVSGIGDVNEDGYEDVMVSRYDDWQGKNAAYIAVYPSKDSISSSPTMIPSASSDPSLVPSFAPSAVPSIAPSGPSTAPTAEPSAPSSKPSEAPPVLHTPSPFYSPSLKPTNLKPRKSSIPTMVPSLLPSRKPVSTTKPSTISPSSAPSTIAPTMKGSPKPSKRMNVTYIEVGGMYDLRGSSGDEMFVISAERGVTMVVGKGGVLERGRMVYKVLPLSEEVEEAVSIVITGFDVEQDVIDLSAFRGLYNVSDLSYSTYPLELILSSKQRIVLSSNNQFEVSSKNFIFSLRSNAESNNSSDDNSLNFLTSATVMVPFSLLLVLTLISLIFGRIYNHPRKKNDVPVRLKAIHNNSSSGSGSGSVTEDMMKVKNYLERIDETSESVDPQRSDNSESITSFQSFHSTYWSNSSYDDSSSGIADSSDRSSFALHQTTVTNSLPIIKKSSSLLSFTSLEAGRRRFDSDVSMFSLSDYFGPDDDNNSDENCDQLVSVDELRENTNTLSDHSVMTPFFSNHSNKIDNNEDSVSTMSSEAFESQMEDWMMTMMMSSEYNSNNNSRRNTSSRLRLRSRGMSNMSNKSLESGRHYESSR